MKCQNCGKEEATVKYYENINGEKREIMLCRKCAENLKITDFSNVLSYFFYNQPKELLEDKYTEKVCDKCSFGFNNYLEKGLFGCPNCYNVFSEKIDLLLTKIHGKNRHLITQSDFNVKTSGKFKNNNFNNNSIDKITDINKLKKLLQESIQAERYEDCAKIRDRIKELSE